MKNTSIHDHSKRPSLGEIILSAFLAIACRNVWPDTSICRVSDPGLVTHTLASDSMVIGISTNGGGYINKLFIPGGIGDVMGKITGMYGRGGQSDIRDQRHGVRYNPTSGGFTDSGGTVCTAIASSKDIILPSHPCSLWFGDYYYDFTYWDDLAPDGYPDTNSAGAFVKIDHDQIPDSVEVGFPNKQAQEITSEFDIYQEYNDKRDMIGSYYPGSGGTDRVMIPAIRHYFHYDFVRDPSPSVTAFSPLRQFPDLKTVMVSDIPVVNPARKQKMACGSYDMGVLVGEFTWRLQRNLWTPAYCFNVRQTDDENTLTATELKSHLNQEFLTYQNDSLKARVSGFQGWFTSPRGYSPLVILSDSNIVDGGHALGLYFPPADNNNFIAGVDSNGTITYTDDRRIQNQTVIQFIGSGMTIGFKQILTGLLKPATTRSADFERVRGEVYFLYGTPHDIYVNAQRIQPFTEKIITVTPRKNSLSIKTNGQKGLVQLISMDGRIVFSTQAGTGQKDFDFQFKGMHGSFIVRFTSGNKISDSKIVLK